MGYDGRISMKKSRGKHLKTIKAYSIFNAGSKYNVSLSINCMIDVGIY
jgi:hypothetical protein